ncbi:MAG: integral rane protein [Frankiales bacterium]|nr:integral rane protein [Frankiales bacterium]
MLIGLLAALAAAVAFGVAAVLQGLAVRRTAATPGVDPRLLVRLVRQPAFVATLALNALGFVLHLTALQSLPLFLVQAVIAASVAVTAVCAVVVLGTRLSRLEWAAVVTVCVGLALLAPSAQSSEAAATGSGLRWAIWAGVLAVAVGGALAGRLYGQAAAAGMGFAAGVGFGLVGLSARLLPDLSPATVVRDAAFYALVVAGAIAFLLYATAMQHGSVTTVTAVLVVPQTAVPAVLGVALLGDRVREGATPLAVAGFVLALAGATALSRLEAQPGGEAAIIAAAGSTDSPTSVEGG